MPTGTAENGDGLRHISGVLTNAEQQALAAQTLALAERAGWQSPVTPGGQPFSVRQVNFGPLGWVSDRKGYRYQATHPGTGAPWPALPRRLVALWKDLLPGAPAPECCLVNHYAPGAKMGLHRDADEEDHQTAILTLSLGAPARFRVGGPRRGGPTRSFRVESGDVIVMGGASRGFYHGIDRLLAPDPLFGPLPVEGRLSLTLRRVTLSSQAPHQT